MASKCGLVTLNAYSQWRGQDIVKYFYSDNSQELATIPAFDSIPHDTSEPGDPQSTVLRKGTYKKSSTELLSPWGKLD